MSGPIILSFFYNYSHIWALQPHYDAFQKILLRQQRHLWLETGTKAIMARPLVMSRFQRASWRGGTLLRKAALCFLVNWDCVIFIRFPHS